MELVKIEVITGMSKLPSLKSALKKIGVTGMTVIQVLGCGIEMGKLEYEPEEPEEMSLLPKQQINIVVDGSILSQVIETIKQELYTGHIGDGKIFVYSVSDVIRIRTGDEGLEALTKKIDK
ncbi:MAG: P-II family nitrogen regulator [Lachnospiraceae bacterium]